MSAYEKLISESFDFDFEEIQKTLKSFNSKLKSYQRASNQQKNLIFSELERSQTHLQEIFNRPRSNSFDRTRLETLEKQFKQLLLTLAKIQPIFQVDLELHNSPVLKRDEFDGKMIEDQSLVYQDLESLREKQIKKRKEDVDQLSKDFTIVNELFKDSANLVLGQGERLDEAEDRIDVAVDQTNKANIEMRQGSVYQENANKKLWVLCIGVTALVVVLVMVLGVVYY